MTCDLCGQKIDDLAQVLDHLRVMHPDRYGDGPERWPDGSVVLHMPDIEPEDVTDGGVA